MPQVLEGSSTFVQGLYVMGMGMAVVFAALTLVMLAIMALDRIFRVKTEAAPQIQTQEARPAVPTAPSGAPVSASSVAAPVSANEGLAEDFVAAIGLAIALRLQETEATPPAPVKVMAVTDDDQVWAAIGRLQ